MTGSRTPETARYLDGLATGVLLYQKCLDCDAVVWHPRHVCPECWGNSLDWRASDCHGSLYTFTTVHVGASPAWTARGPYTIAMVELDEGFWVMTHIAARDVGKIQIGARVVVRITGNDPVPLEASFEGAGDRTRTEAAHA